MNNNNNNNNNNLLMISNPKNTSENLKVEKKINFRKEIRACVNCRKNHKKCDGKLPCSFCVRRKIECVENKKRKPVGRPKKTEEILPNKAQCLEIVKMITCEKCSTKQKFGSKFCNNCGNKIFDQNERKSGELVKEMQILEKKNRDLLNIIQMNMFTSTHMWFMMKLSNLPTNKVIYPMPSFILEFSPSFQNLLGYPNLSDIYYNDLLPKHHLTILDNPSITIRIEKVEGLKSPKLVYRDSLFIRHVLGHYVHLLVNASLYFDPITKNPSMRMIYVEKIVNMHVDKDSIPLQHNFFSMTFYCEDTNKLPEMIKKIRYEPEVQNSNNKTLALTNNQFFTNNTTSTSYTSTSSALPNSNFNSSNFFLSQSLQIPNSLVLPSDDLIFDSTYDNLFSFN